MSQKPESEPVRPDSVHRVEIVISDLLRAGVAVSLAIVILGTFVSFSRHRDYSSSAAELTRITGQDAVFPHSRRQIWQGLTEFRGAAIVMCGLILLIATPIMRVAVSIVVFAIQRDFVFVAITAAVFALLVLSFLLGKAGG